MNKNGATNRPPMGWNSYDYYDTTVTEDQVKANADYMAKNLKEYGWEYIVVDIQWYAHHAGSQREQFQYIPFSHLEMDDTSRLQPDPIRFPSSQGGAGFAPLAAYIHSLGLKFGIHIMRGIPRIAAHNHCQILGTDVTADQVADPSSICGWNPDMYGVRNTEAGQIYYNSLLELYAKWGVDFMKCDDICNTNLYRENPYSARHEIEMLSKAIAGCGRSIVLSLSPGPALIEQAWHYETHANMWRITDDFWDNWDLLKDMFHRCELWQNHVKAGCYPDCDMLPLGYLGKGFGEERSTRFTREEQRTMMSLWCLFGSPLMLGAEMTKLDDWTMSLLTNRQVLSMLTPKFHPHQICLTDDMAVWEAYDPEMYDAETNPYYLAMFNLGDRSAEFSLSIQDLNLPQTLMNSIEETKGFSAANLWTNETLRITGLKIPITIPAHGCCLYTLSH